MDHIMGPLPVLSMHSEAAVMCPGCCLHWWLRNYLALASQNLGNGLLSWAGSEDERFSVETPEALLLQDFKAFWAFGAVGSPNQCDMLHGSIVSCSARFGEESGKCELFPLNYGACVCVCARILYDDDSICLHLCSYVMIFCYLLCLIKID